MSKDNGGFHDLPKAGQPLVVSVEKAIRQLKQQPGNGLFVCGVKLAQSLTDWGLIDEYELIVHPRLAGHGPTLFAGLSRQVDLKLVDRQEFKSGVVALRYERVRLER